MPLTIAHLGPAGTYAEQAALAYADWYSQRTQQATPLLCPCPSIAQALQSTAAGHTQIAVSPVENSIEGSVSVTLDTLWQLDILQIQQALVLPIEHVLIAQGKTLQTIQAVYSHPQPLGQCQAWLKQTLPQATLVPTTSTTDALQYLDEEGTIAAIASEHAAQLYQLPILQRSIQDHPDNCTRFWMVSRKDSQLHISVPQNSPIYTSLAFSLPANVPGALLQPLKIFNDRHINLSRIESRPSKRSLGEYVFFVDAEAALDTRFFQSALDELASHTEVLKVFGSYPLLQMDESSTV
ncbi:prephenate dehydratase [Acaryochloris sp. IP29b_bin.148]|uniref:prephenate dehydratase n=1 Tax=Acaryochloris sp. IP29b_bin.148 TaxID=2969218 RepID=UPI00261AB2BA|nr:prephenate dehydratase [Acaryochloris sp. IP29b_bin.148]